MTIAVGATSKGRTGSGTTQPTGSVTTQASGSTFVIGIAWSGGTFSSLVDSKLNTYTQIDANRAVGSSDNARLYYCENGTGGTLHTATFTTIGTSTITIFFLEITGGLTSGILDQSIGRSDTSSPFTLAAGLTTTQAAEILVALMFGNTGSNPGTHAETGLGSSTIQTGAEETNGSTFFAGCFATSIKSSTGTFNPSFTESGATGAAVFLATFKEATGGATTSKTLSDTTSLSDQALDVTMRVRLQSDSTVLADQLIYGARRGNITSDGILTSDGTVSGAKRGVVASELLSVLDDDLQYLRRTRQASDAISVTDGFISWRRIARVSQDTIDLLDGFSRTVTGSGTVYGKVMSDTLDVTEGFVSWRRLKRLMADNADILDGFSKTLIGVGIVYAKVMSDVTTLVDDNGQRWVLRNSRLTDAVGLSDAVLRALARVRILGENLEFSDGVIRFLRAVRVSSEPLDIADELVRAYFADQIFNVALVFGHREVMRMSHYDPMNFAAREPSLRFGGH